MRIFPSIVLCIVLFSCSDKEQQCVEQPKTTTEVTLNWQPLDELFAEVKSKQEFVEMLAQYPVLRDNFLRRSEYPNDSVFINTLYDRFTNPHFDSLILESKRVFGDQNILRKEFEEAFTNLHYYYPNIPIPNIQTIVSGLDTDLFVSDTLIIIGLDYYLGKGAKYRPVMYDYLLQGYTPENIVPSVLLLYGIDSRINATNEDDKTVLADMVAYGKSYYFAKRMLPCKPDSVFMNYSAKEWQDSYKNQDLIWYRLIEDKVFYATNSLVKQRYLGDRPNTIEVGPECPGRIGQWLGWQVVNSYMRSHEEVTLQQLMKMSDADKIFKESKYKAKRK